MDNSFEKLINRVLDGRYRIENVLGIGGMAYVLKAADLQNGNRTVAIKILNDEFNKDETSVKRFINESEAVSMISAPNIVEIHDVVISDTLKYIVMEYIDGITLKDYIDKIGSLGWREAVHYIKQILRGLSAAHDKGIIHRDVKPQNIMLLNDGKVKVTDFGIAKLPKAEPLTMTDKAIGTVNYISPEQASGGKVDFKSDIYSTGVMLYEMVTGKLPFTAESPVAVAMMQVSEEPVPPREINPAVPIGLEQIILKSMSKDPQARFSSANAMIKALDYFVKNPTVVFAQSEGSGGTVRNRSLEQKNSESKKKNTSRPMYPIILGITLAFFTVAIISGVYLLTHTDVSHEDGLSGIDKLLGVDGNNSNERKMKVESFVGRIYGDELVRELEEKGYRVVKVNYDRIESQPQNCIINQEPEAGATRIKPDGKKKIDIELYVNRGALETRMPNVELLSKDEATRNLVNTFNLMLSDSYDTSNIKIEEVFSDYPIDMVVETSPKSGEAITITSDLNITLFVSKGPENQIVIMPNIVGSPEAEARRVIMESGLSLGNIKREYSSAQPAGFVIRSSVEAGTEVEEKETAIDIVVSLGVKPENTLPSVDNNNDSGNGSENTGEGSGGLEALLGMRENNEQ